MHVSVIIPVWNGQDTLAACLDSIYAHSDINTSVICVDNASSDGSLDLITADFPEVMVIQQPVNLGFAGAVNAGVMASADDVFVLLNQDCVVQPGWLNAVLDGLYDDGPRICGCLIETPDGEIDHAGAYIHRPDARGTHLTEIPKDSRNYAVDYVTGALFAFTRDAWDVVGDFDEGFYPAYFEESDYCYRARLRGIETVMVPRVCAVHYHSSPAWQVDPVKHAANQHRSRYRFVSKHFNEQELLAFFEEESRNLEAERYLSEALGRALAARDTLVALPDILRRRSADLGQPTTAVRRRHLQVGFADVCRSAYARAKELAPLTIGGADSFDLTGHLNSLEQGREREYELLSKIFFRDPRDDRPESSSHRLFRVVVLRTLSLVTGREFLLRSRLAALHVSRMDRLHRALSSLMEFASEQNAASSQVLSVLDTLLEYEYR